MTAASYVERYRAGLHEPVWNELIALEAAILEEPVRADALETTREVMVRLRRNLERLVRGLEQQKVQFGMYPDGDTPSVYEGPLCPPDPHIDEKIAELERVIGGPIPLSLLGFWKWVGTVNLLGVHDDFAGLPGVLDPLWVERIDYTISEYPQWQYRREDDDDDEPFGAQIAPDSLHKDNISGGAPYDIALPKSGIDGILRNEGSDRYFVDYLRYTLIWGGYPGFENQSERFPSWLATLATSMEPF